MLRVAIESVHILLPFLLATVVPRALAKFKSLPDNDLQIPGAGSPPAGTTQPLDFRKTAALAHVLAVGAVALLATVLVLQNDYVYDDLPLIVTDPRYPTFDSLSGVLTSPYWPPPFSPDLWRPFASFLFGTLRLTVGAERAWAGHLLSLLLYVTLSVSVYRMLRQVAPASGAFAAAVLFAAHPVHAEAVANTVNVSEIVVGITMSAALVLYLCERNRGGLSSSTTLQLIALQCFAFGWKETGLLIPAVLAAAELTLVEDASPWSARIGKLRPAALGFLLSSLSLVLLRTQVLGDIKGTFTTIVLQDQPIGVRALTMLSVSREWFRLLVWPATLRIEYSVAEIQPAIRWGVAQTTGAVLLALTAFAALFALRRLPLISFGVLFAGITIAPVHNVVFATGTVLAERTLLLPSIGTACVIAALLGRVRWGHSKAARLLAISVVTLASAGVLRFALRLREWRTHESLWEHAVATEPRNAPAWQALGVMALREQNYVDAELFLRRAAELNPLSPVPLTVLGDTYAAADRCGPALASYQAALALKHAHPRARLNAAVCALWLGQYNAVRPIVEAMVADSANGQQFRELLHTADSAQRLAVPPRTIRHKLRLTEEITYAMFPAAPRKMPAKEQ